MKQWGLVVALAACLMCAGVIDGWGADEPGGKAGTTEGASAYSLPDMTRMIAEERESREKARDALKEETGR